MDVDSTGMVILDKQPEYITPLRQHGLKRLHSSIDTGLPSTIESGIDTTLELDTVSPPPQKRLRGIQLLNLEEELQPYVAEETEAEANLLREMKLTDKKTVLLALMAEDKFNPYYGRDDARKPWGHFIFNDSTTGPGNEMPSYEVVEEEGPLAIASWEHDYLIGTAQGDTDLQEWIDERYIDEVDRIRDWDPDTLNWYKYNLIKIGIEKGAPVYYKFRELFLA